MIAINSGSAYRRVLLAAYGTYVVLGNFPRPGGYLVNGGGLPVMEVVLALVAALGFLRLRSAVPRGFPLVAATVLASSGAGYLTHGVISLLPALYAVRLVLILGCSVVIARVLQEGWGNDPRGVFRFFTVLFVIQAALGWVIWVEFPDMQRLLDEMRSVGLFFNGEPHQSRMLGPLLDPNFFGNLLVLAIGITVGLTVASGISWPLAVYALCIATLLQTLSRSSLLGLVLWAATFALLRVAWSEEARPPWRVYAVLILVAAGTVVLLQQPVSTIVQRISAVPSDLSAAHRLESFKAAALLLLEPDIFLVGLGYNFLPVVLKARSGLTGIDASVANLFVAFGVPLGLLVVWAMTRWVRGVAAACRSPHPLFGDVLVAYVVAAAAMSMFTNLLFFAPFLWVVLPLLCYVEMASRAVSGGMTLVQKAGMHPAGAASGAPFPSPKAEETGEGLRTPTGSTVQRAAG